MEVRGVYGLKCWSNGILGGAGDAGTLPRWRGFNGLGDQSHLRFSVAARWWFLLWTELAKLHFTQDGETWCITGNLSGWMVQEGRRCVGWEDVGNFSPGWPIPWGRCENFHALCVGFLLQKEGNFGPVGLSREQTKSRDAGLVHHSWQGGLNEAASSRNVIAKARGLISVSKSLMGLPTSVHGLSASVGTGVTWGGSSGQGVRARGSCSFWATVSFAMLLGCCFYPLQPSQQPCLPCPWL